jgi:protein involved in polysaccharide export with SLBB domain
LKFMKTLIPTRLPGRTNFILAVLLLSGSLFAQQGATAPVPTGTDSTGSSSSGDPSNPGSSNSGSTATSLSAQASLSAAQIGAVLQRRPEVVIELKSFVADQAQQKGVPLQADSITDEMLYTQIASSPDLRASITLWLLSRGYVSETDLHRSLTDPGSDENGIYGQPSRAQADSFGQLPTDLLSGSSQAPSISLPDASTLASANASPSATQASNGSRGPQHNITDSPEVLRLPTPYNLLSLRDLYTQIPQDDTRLKRFGSEMFLNRGDSLGGRSAVGPKDTPIDLPVGPDYVLGSGDGLSINLSGGVSQTLTRIVDREGKIALPEAGTIVIAGLTLQHAQTVIEDALKHQYRSLRVDITIARLRTVRIYVVGDVQRPGAYDLSSLSTPLNALYAAGGPTSVGSLRTLRHMRGTQLIREVDLYDFLLHGKRMNDERLEAGDTLLVPPAGPQVAIYGMVKRPAIYELNGNATLSEVLEDAGGATVAAALNHITVDRIQPNQQRETLSLDLPSTTTGKPSLQAITSFTIKDGDRVHVVPILPYSERVIYVEGHVVRPGRLSYRDGMQLNDVLRSYQDLLPEPAARGDIIRLVAPDLHPETIQFEVADVLIGNSNLTLQPFDTIRIFGRYEVDSPQVTIRGEVLRPGAYPLSQGMTTVQLVKMAGGFKRDALLESADLTSYTVENGKKVVSQRASIEIGVAVNGDRPAADVPLKPGDILTIHQISGWNDIGASITLAGEVTYPGSYGLQEGERLSSVLRRAGGFRETAYPDGAILVRTQVKDLEEKSRAELIRQIETTSASARLSPNLSGQDQSASLQAAAQQQAEVLRRLRSQPASGRLVIHVSADIASWENTPADIEMRSGDVLTIPKRPGFVLVSGQVYNASALTFVPGKEAGWYLRRAGGTNDVANRKEIFVIRANGSVVGRRSGEWYSGNVLSTRLSPGDVIVVPQRIIGSLFWRNLLTVAQLSSSIAITAAVAGIF